MMAPMDPSREDFEPPLGARAGAYQLIKVLGKGAFGIVYLGREDNGAEVALKLLRGPYGHDREAFEDEMKGLARASHAPDEAKVVQLVAGWQEAALGGCYCLATTPYCSGGSLEDMIKTKPPPDLETRLRWALDVAETLQLLHCSYKVRLFHGDLTLRNVGLCLGKLSRRLEAYVLDLGVSMHNHPYGMTEALKQCSTSVAPEMEEGEGVFDQSADVWSWGVLLYALLAWSLSRLGLEPQRAWLASLPGRERAVWEEELKKTRSQEHATADHGEEKGMEKRYKIDDQGFPELWKELLDLMVDCLRTREERVGMETVVYVMRKLLGHQDEPSTIVLLEQELRRGRAEGGLKPAVEVGVMMRKAAAHRELQQPTIECMCLQRAVRLARTCTFEPADYDMLPRCLLNLATVYKDKGEFDPALPLYEEAVEAARTALPTGHAHMASYLAGLAECHDNMGNYDLASSLLEEALSINRASSSPDGHLLVSILTALANLHRLKMEYERGLALALEAYGLARRARATRGWHYDNATCAATLAGLYHNMGNHEQAGFFYREALVISRLVRELGDHATSVHLSNLGALYVSQGEHDKALPVFIEALETSRATLPPMHPGIATSLHSLAGAHRGLGDCDKALACYEETLEINRVALSRNHPDTATCLVNLGLLCKDMQQYDRALSYCEEAVAIWRAVSPPREDRVVESLAHLAAVHVARGEHERAVSLYEEALAIRRRLLEPQHAELAPLLCHLAGAYKATERVDQALEVYKEAAVIMKAAPAADARTLAWVLWHVARLHKARREYALAFPPCKEALAMLQGCMPPAHKDVVACQKLLDSLARRVSSS